jgi:CHASE2 domain-containing sensor protein
MVIKLKNWLKENIFVKDMFIYIFFATIIFYIPTWVSALYGTITGNDLLYGVSAAWIIIWAGPFTPTIPIILAIAVFLKQVVKRITGKKDEE